FIKNPPAAKKTVIQPSSPVKKIYTNRGVIKVGLIYGIVGMTLIVQTTFILSFMLDEGLDTRFAGQLIALNGILAIFSSPFWGGISDRLGSMNALILALVLNALATTIPVLFSNTLGFTIYLVIQEAVAFGIMTLVQALSTEQVSTQDTPIAFSYT